MLLLMCWEMFLGRIIFLPQICGYLPTFVNPLSHDVQRFAVWVGSCASSVTFDVLYYSRCHPVAYTLMWSLATRATDHSHDSSSPTTIDVAMDGPQCCDHLGPMPRGLNCAVVCSAGSRHVLKPTSLGRMVLPPTSLCVVSELLT